MKLDQFLKDNDITNEDFSDEIATSTEAVRLYRKEKRIPRPDVMDRIKRATKGEVTANDFYKSE